MRDITALTPGTFLTAEESAAMIEASTLRGADRYRVEPVTGGWSLWDAEDAETIPASDGRTVLTQSEAQELQASYLR